MPRVLVACVPRRRAASSATTHSCTSGPLNGAPNTSASSASLPEPPRIGASAIGAHLHGAALGPGPADALEHARGRRRGADRARRAHVVRAMGLGPGGEVVALDRALEPLALRGPGDLHGL